MFIVEHSGRANEKESFRTANGTQLKSINGALDIWCFECRVWVSDMNQQEFFGQPSNLHPMDERAVVDNDVDRLA